MEFHVLVFSFVGAIEAVYTQIPGVTCGLQNGFSKISRKRRGADLIDDSVSDSSGDQTYRVVLLKFCVLG